MEEKKTHGGRRSGAGRPKGDSRLYSFRCPGPLADQLDAKENKTEFIRSSLMEALGNEHSMEAVGMETSGLEIFGEAMPATRVSPLHLPFFDQTRVVAGFPIPLDNDERAQDIEILSMLCPHPEASYLIRVQGNSMIDAGILSGDIVIVDKSRRDPSAREIAVCEINGEYTLKHFVREGGKAWLVPANPEFSRREITREDEFSIWGTVTYIIHKAREQK